MRGYGLPRVDDVEFPSASDIRGYGLNMQPESGRTTSKKRRASRRIWKRKYRQLQRRKLFGFNTTRRYGRQVD
jgi:hypothetical protein